MVGLLLVEDEEAIISKLVNNVDWSKHGFSPVLSAANGQEALAVLAEHHIDIMVTDIQMPFMNGIELIKEVKKRGFRMKIIVISGFAEFEYARESINLAVSEYLLKPFATKRLLEVALRLQEEIKNEQAEALELRTLQTQINKNMSALREKFIADLLHRKVATAEISSKLRFFGFEEYEDFSYQVVVMENHEEQGESFSEEEKYVLNLQFYRQADRLLDGAAYRCLMHNYDHHQLVAIFFIPDQDFPLYLEEFLNNLRLRLNKPVTFGVSHCYQGWQELPVAYREACVALQSRYLHGLNRVYSISDLNLDHPGYHQSFYHLYQHRIFDDLRIGAQEEVQADLTNLFAEISSSRLSPETIRIIAANLLLLTCATLNELGYHPEELFTGGFLPLSEISNTQCLSELEVIFRRLFTRINSMVEEKRESVNQQKIDRIRHYLEEHYASDITLSALAKEHRISPSYLSLLFTEWTGKKFTDYLTDCRIDKAKELLKHSEMRIYEIAAAVGYKDPYYFSNCFKKITGQTPSEYREGLEKAE